MSNNTVVDPEKWLKIILNYKSFELHKHKSNFVR